MTIEESNLTFEFDSDTHLPGNALEHVSYS